MKLRETIMKLVFLIAAVYSITHKSDYDIADIGKKKQALFFILPDEKTTYYPIAANTFF